MKYMNFKAIYFLLLEKECFRNLINCWIEKSRKEKYHNRNEIADNSIKYKENNKALINTEYSKYSIKRRDGKSSRNDIIIRKIKEPNSNYQPSSNNTIFKTTTIVENIEKFPPLQKSTDSSNGTPEETKSIRVSFLDISFKDIYKRNLFEQRILKKLKKGKKIGLWCKRIMYACICLVRLKIYNRSD